MVCEMRVNAEGKVTARTFFEGLMRSARRLTYTKVAAYPSPTPPQFMHRKCLRSAIAAPSALYGVFKALHRARAEATVRWTSTRPS